jgi:hypothetical protein
MGFFQPGKDSELIFFVAAAAAGYADKRELSFACGSVLGKEKAVRSQRRMNTQMHLLFLFHPPTRGAHTTYAESNYFSRKSRARAFGSDAKELFGIKSTVQR